MTLYLEYGWILNYCEPNNRALDLEDEVRNYGVLQGPSAFPARLHAHCVWSHKTWAGRHNSTIPTNIIVFREIISFLSINQNRISRHTRSLSYFSISSSKADCKLRSIPRPVHSSASGMVVIPAALISSRVLPALICFLVY